jgi:uncharacterized protein YeeX (DUF496 family)
MNKIMHDIPNKIKQPSQCCIYCGKSYLKKMNLNKHLIICELLQHCKNKKKIINDEDDDSLPSQRKMFEMLVELGNKYNKLEEKINAMNKCVVQKNKKINILSWLNENVKPSFKFETILDTIHITEEDINKLLENSKSFYEILNEIFERTIYNNGINYPLFSAVQKSNTFYIYSVDNIWCELTKEIFTKFMNKLHIKIIKLFYDLKNLKNIGKKSNDVLSNIWDKANIKLMSIDFDKDSIYCKIKSMMFSKMKLDLKTFIVSEEFDT